MSYNIHQILRKSTLENGPCPSRIISTSIFLRYASKQMQQFNKLKNSNERAEKDREKSHASIYNRDQEKRVITDVVDTKISSERKKQYSIICNCTFGAKCQGVGFILQFAP